MALSPPDFIDWGPIRVKKSLPESLREAFSYGRPDGQSFFTFFAVGVTDALAPFADLPAQQDLPALEPAQALLSFDAVVALAPLDAQQDLSDLDPAQAFSSVEAAVAAAPLEAQQDFLAEPTSDGEAFTN